MFDYPESFDVIVVGGGHAGIEAAAAAARLGRRTLLLEMKLDQLGMLSCNPAIGGIGKSHLVKEIDALGGIMAQAADRSGINARILNASKGPAVRAIRWQTDRQLYRKAVRELLDAIPHLYLFQTEVIDLIIENDTVVGVVTPHARYRGSSVVLTCGTFLSGLVHMGDHRSAAGRAGDMPSKHLSESLRRYPLRVGRLKTGTPPRIDGRSIAWSALERQPSVGPVCMSLLSALEDVPPQIDCFITQTNAKTHDIIRDALHRSAMYGGHIEGVGPRYCPSIEDKVVRFSERLSHTIFLEPEGLFVNEFYPSGLSNSLPYEVQLAFIRSIKGLEQAHITRPGYAIEYDYFDPRDLTNGLEHRYIRRLFLAGQINGTTGYEEAAAQGLLAGINAACCDEQVLVLSRKESYIGVMVDDLVTRGTEEPYRMFTSRAEYRLYLREDNAYERLLPVLRRYPFLHPFKDRIEARVEKEEVLKKRLSEDRWRAHPVLVEWMRLQGLESSEGSFMSLIRRPECDLALIAQLPDYVEYADVLEKVVSDIKYQGYVARQEQEDRKMSALLDTIIPHEMRWEDTPGLSNEIKEKLKTHSPRDLRQASLISGMTPSALSLMYWMIKKRS